MTLMILDVALQEVEEASDYYESQHEGLGHEFELASQRQSNVQDCQR